LKEGLRGMNEILIVKIRNLQEMLNKELLQNRLDSKGIEQMSQELDLLILKYYQQIGLKVS
jgi:hypothetical protein